MKEKSVDKILNEVKEKKSFPNFVILFFIISLLIIDFFPYFKSIEIINPQFLYLSLINLIISVYIYFNTSLIFHSIFSILKKSYLFKLYLLFIVLCAITFFFAKNTSLVLTKITEIVIIFCLTINLTILLKNKLDLFYKIMFIVSISAFFQAWQQLYDFIIVPKQTTIIDLLNNIKGNTGNINILAVSLTIKIPFILLGITHFKSFKKFFLVIALFCVLTVIFLTGARTAMINIILIFTVFIVYLIREHSLRKSIIKKSLSFIIPLILAILFSNSIFKISKNNDRYASLENRISQINTKDESAQARLSFWRNTLKMTQKSPFFGIGLGNYQVESVSYEKTTENDSWVSLHAHNDFLEILAETGIVNGLIYLSIFIYLLIINLRNILKSKNTEKKTTALLALMLLIVYGIDSFFNFPMYRPTVAIFFSLLIALTLTNESREEYSFSLKNNSLKPIILVLILIASLTSYSAYIIYKSSNLEFLIKRDNINDNKKGFLTGDDVVNKMAAYPNVLSSSESFYEYAGIYYIREKQYEKAHKYFSKAKKINGYSGRIDFYKQVIAREKGDLDSAYVYAKQAFYIRPRNYNIYKVSVGYAISKRDTLEILKEHKLFNKYRPMSETWLQAAKGLQSSGYNYESLINFVNKALKEFPQDSILIKEKNNLLITSFLIRGQDFESKSDLNTALQSYEKALNIDPKNVYISQNIGFNYLKQGQIEKAIKALVEALNYPGLDDGKTEFYLAICYLKLNDKVNALKYFSLSKNKNYPEAKQLLAQIQNTNIVDEEAIKKRKNDLLIADILTEGQKFEEQKKLDEALKSYQKALKIDPKSIYAAQNIGFYYLKNGQSKKAINYLLNALKYPGLNDGKTEYFLAICYLQDNDNSNTCKYLNISETKNYPEASKMIERVCK